MLSILRMRPTDHTRVDRCESIKQQTESIWNSRRKIGTSVCSLLALSYASAFAMQAGARARAELFVEGTVRSIQGRTNNANTAALELASVRRSIMLAQVTNLGIRTALLRTSPTKIHILFAYFKHILSIPKIVFEIVSKTYLKHIL